MKKISNWPDDLDPNVFAGRTITGVCFQHCAVRLKLFIDAWVPTWTIVSMASLRHTRHGAVDDYALQSHERHGPSHLPEIVGCVVVRSSVDPENDALTLELDNGHSVTFLVTGYESYNVSMGERQIFM